MFHRFLAFAMMSGVFTSICFGQCATQYSDSFADAGTGEITAWASLIDNYTDANSCAPSWGSFVHSYYVTVSITSPTGRTSTGWSGGSQQNGYSSGYTTAYAAITTNEELGNYTFDSFENIDCSVAGAGFYTTSTSGSTYISDWADFFGFEKTPDGQEIVLSQDDFDTLVNASALAAAAGAVVFLPGVVGPAIAIPVAIAVGVGLTYLAAKYIYDHGSPILRTYGPCTLTYQTPPRNGLVICGYYCVGYGGTATFPCPGSKNCNAYIPSGLFNPDRDCI